MQQREHIDMGPTNNGEAAKGKIPIEGCELRPRRFASWCASTPACHDVVGKRSFLWTPSSAWSAAAVPATHPASSVSENFRFSSSPNRVAS